MSVVHKKFGALSAFSRFLANLKTLFVAKTDIASGTDNGITKLYSATGQNTDGAISQKAATDALSGKIPYSGGDLTGNLYISPYYDESIVDPEGGQVMVVCKGRNNKGTHPSSSTEWHTMVMAVDKTGSTNNIHKYGQVQTSVTTAGAVSTQITAYKDEAGSSTGASISISVAANGTVSTAAPTPAVSSNNTNIATTAYVNTHNDTYVISDSEITTMWEAVNANEREY